MRVSFGSLAQQGFLAVFPGRASGAGEKTVSAEKIAAGELFRRPGTDVYQSVFFIKRSQIGR